VAQGEYEIYHYDDCVDMAAHDPSVVAWQPDCVAHYAVCKLVLVAGSEQS
jgi:hypothetical protein